MPLMDYDVFLCIPFFFIGIIFINRYLLGSLLKRLFVRKLTSVIPDATPTVCVIMPLYNEGPIIQRTIRGIMEQNYPPEKLSVIVMDDCSTDESYQLALDEAVLYGSRAMVLRASKNQGKRKNIAHAVRLTEAEFVISVDSDALIAPDAVARLMPFFNSEEIAAVGGRVHVLNANENWLTKLQTIKYFFGYEYLKNLENSMYSVMCLSGCLTAYRRRVLLELEPILENRNVLGVPIKYGEDRFLTRQIIKAGYHTRLNLEACCYTRVPNTLGRLFAQQLRWRRSNIIDYSCGVSHAWKLNPLISMHFFTLFSLLLIYPVFLISAFLRGAFFASVSFHIGILSIFALIYAFKTKDMPPEYRVHPIAFLPMCVVMPVTYLLITILGLFTLDSDNWETRKPSNIQNDDIATAHRAVPIS